MRRSISAARCASISCPTTAAASASQGHGRPLRPEAGQAPDQRPDQRVAAEAAVEVGEVDVDPERAAHPLDRHLELLAARPAPGRARSSIGGARDARRGRPPRPGTGPGRAPAARPAPAPGCRRRGGAASRPRPAPAASGPSCRRGSRYGDGGRTSTSRLQRPSRWTSTRKERLATTFWRSRRRPPRRRGDRALRGGAADRAHGGDGGGAGEDPAGGGDRGGLAPRGAGPAARSRRLLVAGRQRADRVGGVAPGRRLPRRRPRRLRAAHSPGRL